MVLAPSGQFTMGVPQDAWPESFGADLRELQAPRAGSVEEPFYISATEVTSAQYAVFVNVSSYQHVGSLAADVGRWSRPRASVTSVSWGDAKAFCTWLSKQEGRAYDLPSVTQWEYACRAGSEGLFCFGNDPDELRHYAWYKENSSGYRHDVGKLRANAWGLHDVHGNVWEWCRDLVPEEFLRREQAPPEYHREGSAYVRGGSYGKGPVGCYAGARWACLPVGTRDGDVGFRVVCGAKTAGAHAARVKKPGVADYREIVEWLHAEGPPDDIFRAVARGDVEAVRSMVRQTSSLVDVIPPGRHPVLIIAAQRGHWKLVKLLVEEGADVNARSSGLTALHIAAAEGQKEVAHLLLDKGADPDSSGIVGHRPLHRAAWHGHAEVAALLLGAGATADARDESGNTPLHMARSLAVARLLLEAGANVNAKNEDGLTPFDCALYGERPDVAELLRQQGGVE